MRANKRGLSPIIATIMIVLLTIMAFGLISQIMIPMLKKWMGDAKTCYDAMDHIEIDAANANTCHKPEAGVIPAQTRIVVKRGLNEKADIASLTIALRVNKNYKSYTIKEGADNIDTVGSQIHMSDSNAQLSLPTPGGGKVYIFDVNADYVMISGQDSKGKTCEDKSTEIINICP